jgi:hypothetical protein
VSFAAIILYIASQRVFIVVSVHFVIESVRKFWLHCRTYQERVRIWYRKFKFCIFFFTVHFHLASRLRMCGAIPPLSQYVFMAWYLVKHRDEFTFVLLQFGAGIAQSV